MIIAVSPARAPTGRFPRRPAANTFRADRLERLEGALEVAMCNDG
jgi:hypothetical protein